MTPLNTDSSAFAAKVGLDKKLLFLAVAKRRGDGALNVVDLATHSTASRTLSGGPVRLLRLRPTNDLWVQGDTLQSVSEAGDVGEPIALHFGRAYASGQVVNVGADRVAVSLTWQGKPLYRVALIDLKQRKVDGVIETRSAGQKAKLGTSHFGKDLGKGMLQSMATLGTSTVVVHTDYYDYGLAARPDGRFVYAIDFSTHEAAVIDTSTLASVTTIGFDKAVARTELSRDGRDLVLFSRPTNAAPTGGQVQRIDLESNTMKN